METGSADRVGHVAHGGHGAAVHVRGVLQVGETGDQPVDRTSALSAPLCRDGLAHGTTPLHL